MRKFKFDKLVRDRIVEHIEKSGNKPVWKTLSDEEYVLELKKKIMEEASELLIDEPEGDELLKELADIQEIIDNLLAALGTSKKRLREFQKKKNEKNGSFRKRLFIDRVEAKDNAVEIDYYLKHPEKYPEIED